MEKRPRALLAFDTATQVGSVAVGLDGEIAVEIALQDSAGHSSSLLRAIDDSLRRVGLSATDLAGVVVGSGPGSFTGVRIAAATAKGMIHALGVPMFAYSSLLATAAQARAASLPVCALFDARGRDVFSATYSFQPELTVVQPPAALSIDEVVARFVGAEPPVFVGDGAMRHADELADRLGASVSPRHFSVPAAASLIWLAEGAPTLGRIPEPAS